MEQATIEAFQSSRLKHETEAYANGVSQATELIEDEPNYKLLCELSDYAKAFEANEDVDVNYIDSLDNYPAALRYYLIKGFYDTVTKAITVLVTSPCENSGACSKPCTRCEDGLSNKG